MRKWLAVIVVSACAVIGLSAVLVVAGTGVASATYAGPPSSPHPVPCSPAPCLGGRDVEQNGAWVPSSIPFSMRESPYAQVEVYPHVVAVGQTLHVVREGLCDPHWPASDPTNCYALLSLGGSNLDASPGLTPCDTSSPYYAEVNEEKFTRVSWCFTATAVTAGWNVLSAAAINPACDRALPLPSTCTETADYGISSDYYMVSNTVPLLPTSPSVSTLPATVVAKVIADAEASPGRTVRPVPVASVDPSYRGVTRLDRDEGFIPTGGFISHGETINTGHGNGVVDADRYRPPGAPGAWGGSNTPLTPVQVHMLPVDNVISAHGDFYTGNGLVRVPDGVTVTTFVPIGTEMTANLGVHVDSGNIMGDDTKYEHTYEPGDLMPNFTFLPLAHSEVGGNGKTVDSPTNLSDLLQPNSGNFDIAACEDFFVPAGDTVDQAMANLPIYTPGSPDVTHLPVGEQATITNDGQFEIISATSGNP